MSQISITITGSKEVQQALNNVTKYIMWTLPSAINTSLRQVQDTIYTDYRRFGTATPSYQNPSKSGRGFTDRTGSLRSSISYDTKISNRSVEGILSAGMPYDVYVELMWGGKYSFLLPAFEQNKQNIFDNISDAVEHAIERMN